MDKSKTMEVLRGMKFMQRKEEKKRRELFEVDQQKQLRERLRAADDGGGSGAALGPHHRSFSSVASGPSAATIVYDTSFPHALYGLSRRSFLGSPHPPSTKAAATDSDNGCDARDDCGNSRLGNEERDAGGDEHHQHRQQEEDGDSAEGSVIDDPTAVSSGTGRFCVKVRAPPLPKKLAKQVAAKKRKRGDE